MRSQAAGAAGLARETLQLLTATQVLDTDGPKNFERIDEKPPFQRRPRHAVSLAFEQEHREVETCRRYATWLSAELASVRYR